MPQPNLTGDTEDNRNDLVPENVATSDEVTKADTSDNVEVISFSETQSEQSQDNSKASEVSEEVTETVESADTEPDPQPTNAAVAQAVAELGDFTGEPQEITTETKAGAVVEQPVVVVEDTATEVPKTQKKGKSWLIGVIIAAVLFLSICGAAIWQFI